MKFSQGEASQSVRSTCVASVRLSGWPVRMVFTDVNDL
jgi:hypothetical protein